jgi:hypothetical protein
MASPHRKSRFCWWGVIDAPVGSYYIPLNQLANLAIAALEPDTQSSFFTNRLVDNLAGIARVMSNLAKVRGVALTSRRFEVLSARLYR